MDFSLLLIAWVEIFVKIKILVKIYVKTQTVNTANNNLIMVNNLQYMHLKLLSNEQWKHAETTGDFIGIKIADAVANSYDSKIKKI